MMSTIKRNIKFFQLIGIAFIFILLFNQGRTGILKWLTIITICSIILGALFMWLPGGQPIAALGGIVSIGGFIGISLLLIGGSALFGVLGIISSLFGGLGIYILAGLGIFLLVMIFRR